MGLGAGRAGVVSIGCTQYTSRRQADVFYLRSSATWQNPTQYSAFAGEQLVGTSKLGVHIPKAGLCPLARVAILGKKR